MSEHAMNLLALMVVVGGFLGMVVYAISKT